MVLLMGGKKKSVFKYKKRFYEIAIRSKIFLQASQLRGDSTRPDSPFIGETGPI